MTRTTTHPCNIRIMYHLFLLLPPQSSVISNMYHNSQRVMFSLFLIFIILTIALLKIQSQFLTKVLHDRRIIMRWERTDNIACHYNYSDDSLPPAEDVAFGGDSIFFHETSCSGGLSSRQACVVESAARLHPNRSVYVLFSASVTEAMLQRSCLKELQKLKVKFFRVHLPKYAEGTGLEDILMYEIKDASGYHIEHAADILRFITLYKYGGFYLDTDTLVIKQLDGLGKNWAGKQELDGCVSNAAMAADKVGIGHEVFKAVLDDISEDYHPELFAYNGPEALTRSLKKICDNGTKVGNFSAEKCKGFEVYKPSVFYRIPYPAYQIIFKPGKISDYNESYGIHLWNRLSHKLDVKKGSLIHDLATKYCPTIVSYFDDHFGL